MIGFIRDDGEDMSVRGSSLLSCMGSDSGGACSATWSGDENSGVSRSS